jgi:hypothetical protein
MRIRRARCAEALVNRRAYDAGADRNRLRKTMATDGPCLIGPAAALLLIDVQGRFAEIAFDAQGILSRLASLIARARLSVPVVYTRQRFDDQIPPIQRLIRPASANTVIDKGSSDAFLDTGLDDWLAGARNPHPCRYRLRH